MRIPLPYPLLAVSALLSACHAGASPITYSQCTSAGVPLRIVSVDMNNLDVKVTGLMARKGSGDSETFRKMVARAKPTVAVTGTFFCTRTRIPVGDMVIDGKLAHFGGLGTAICVSDNNEVQFVQPKPYRHQDWSQYDYVLRSGPRIIHNGQVHINAAAEGFAQKSLLSRAQRVAVGITDNGHMLIVATRRAVLLSEMGNAMRKLGIQEAINLDGGSSVGLYYKGRIVIRPQRRLTNLMVVFDDRARYERMRDDLAPILRRSAHR